MQSTNIANDLSGVIKRGKQTKKKGTSANRLKVKGYYY